MLCRLYAYFLTYIYIVKKVCRKYAERKSLIPTFEMRTLKLKRSTQYCRLMAMRTIVGKPLDSTNNPRIWAVQTGWLVRGFSIFFYRGHVRYWPGTFTCWCPLNFMCINSEVLVSLLSTSLCYNIWTSLFTVTTEQAWSPVNFIRCLKIVWLNPYWKLRV